MRIYAANSVFIEVTRRCNMCCALCLRGDAENIDIQEKYIDAFLDSFEKGAYISSLTFTGGEISLNIPAIRYTLKAANERGIAVGSFYMVTNGKAVPTASCALQAKPYHLYIATVFLQERWLS